MKTHTEVDLGERTRSFALGVVELYAALPDSEAARLLGGRLLASGAAVGASYREARRSRSAGEFVTRMERGLQVLDETVYWLEVMVQARIVPRTALAEVAREAESLVAGFVDAARCARRTIASTQRPTVC